ncbi:restriction endonuclease subunit S [Candidatus Saccharibacteria bacterium]|nr:restriction endonuclease subunit S [Candidatus Saccharibacteria bacterium]
MTNNPTLKREIPTGWEVKTIGDYLKIGNGRDHSKLADGLYPVYGSGGVMRYVSEFLHDGETVLFPRKGTLNNVMYRNEPLWTVDTMFYTSVLVPHSALFVFYSAKMFDFERLNTGTGVPSMTSDIIKKLPIISPDRQTLEQFDKTVAKLYNQIHHNEKEISRLTKLRDKLLPLLMNGQVEVK